MPYSVHSLRPGRALSRLMGFLVGVAIFLPLLAALVIWAGGRFAPSILDSALSSRSGCSLSVESNDTNLLAGRVRFGGQDIAGLPPHRIAQLGIGRSFHHAFLNATRGFQRLNVKQALAHLFRIRLGGGHRECVRKAGP